MLKILPLALTLLLISMPAIASTGNPAEAPAEEPKVEKCNEKVTVLDLSTLTRQTIYLTKNTIWREDNDTTGLQCGPFYSEGKKKIVQSDEKLIG